MNFQKKCPSSETVGFLKKCLRSLGASAVNPAENSDKRRYWLTFIIPAFSLVQVRLFCHLIGSSSSLLPPHWSKFFSLAIPLAFIITGHCCVFFLKCDRPGSFQINPNTQPLSYRLFRNLSNKKSKIKR